MPGGSVNGRPFREGPDSYSRTGIPCGNPKRFQSREVIKMGVQNQNALSRSLIGPIEDIETESDRQLQNLLQKQLHTDITIQEQFNQHKKFSDGVSHFSSTDSLSGTVSLQEYKGLSQLDGYLVELKQCGLTEEEIELKLEDMGHSKSKKLRLNLEPGVRESKLLAIGKKIAAKKKQLEEADHFAGAKKMGRHEMDLEKAISHNSDRAKLLSCLLTTYSDHHAAANSDDPMDHLPEILEAVTKRGQTKASRRKRRHDLKDKTIYDEGDAYMTDPSGISNERDRSSSQEDMSPGCSTNCSDMHIICESKETTENSADNVVNDNNEQSSNLKSLSGKIDSIPEEEIIKERLTIEDIQQLTRFKDYTPGHPTQVLYLKNLPGKVCEEDLIRLFIRFQKVDGPKIIFKLMKGRMKGQAFITFDSITSATEALQLANGYNLKGKPVIIQYGKKIS
ncbi:RNA-binding protein 41-like [Liolophura sinensis]|uniref:RNA-binding protein 41-like n=1 Tax=Liolophura sinensis TaxID=3198878 RepID=UPI0031584179